jgi:flagellar export protein FliJ
MKLDVLRRYRAQQEEVVRMDLVRLRQELQDAETRTRLLDEQMKRTADAYPAKTRRGVGLEEFLVRQSMLTAEASNLSVAMQVEGRLREAWNLKQEELREAMQDRRTLDRLVERTKQQRRVVQGRVEQTEMDEAARRRSVM